MPVMKVTKKLLERELASIDWDRIDAMTERYRLRFNLKSLRFSARLYDTTLRSGVTLS